MWENHECREGQKLFLKKAAERFDFSMPHRNMNGSWQFSHLVNVCPFQFEHQYSMLVATPQNLSVSPESRIDYFNFL